MTRQERLASLLQDNFSIDHMDLVNESHMHSVPPNSETHFKLVIVSADFDGKRKVARHQQIYALVGELMQEGLHALAIHAYTPEEWASVQQAPESPNCMGGSKKS